MELLKSNILLFLGMFLLVGIHSHAQDETEGVEFTMNLQVYWEQRIKETEIELFTLPLLGG